MLEMGKQLELIDIHCVYCHFHEVGLVECGEYGHDGGLSENCSCVWNFCMVENTDR